MPSRSALSAPSLGGAASFRVLAGSTVTNTGASTIEGDLGVSPGSAITGFPPGQVLGGTTHAADATALQAQSDVTAAYGTLASDPCGFELTGQDLGGKTLTTGVYCFTSGAQLTGSLTLDAEGDPNAVFVFQIASTLTTASNSSVVLINGAQDCRVFWQIGSSATLGTDTLFTGSMLALTSIALQTGAGVEGRALARNGAVTMDDNHVFGGTCLSAIADAGSDAGAGGSGGGGGAIDAGGSGGGGGGAIDAGGSGGGGGAIDAGGSGGGGSGGGGATGGGGGSIADAGSALCCGGSDCGGTCSNLSLDVDNCGACGHACGPGAFCAAGTCTACSPLCGGACVDLVGDHDNCGACGHVCLGTESCSAGACTACAMVCAGACVDFASDDANCGSCGNACPGGSACSSGTCVACATTCSGSCVDLLHDTNNCGACGRLCGWGETCISGFCACVP